MRPADRSPDICYYIAAGDTRRTESRGIIFYTIYDGLYARESPRFIPTVSFLYTDRPGYVVFLRVRSELFGNIFRTFSKQSAVSLFLSRRRRNVTAAPRFLRKTLDSDTPSVSFVLSRHPYAVSTKLSE